MLQKDSTLQLDALVRVNSKSRINLNLLKKIKILFKRGFQGWFSRKDELWKKRKKGLILIRVLNILKRDLQFTNKDFRGKNILKLAHFFLQEYIPIILYLNPSIYFSE